MQASRPFQPLDQPRDAPPDVQERTRIFAAKVKWTFASTMPQWPHWYVVRAKLPRGLRPDYDRFFADTHAHGWRGRFAGRLHDYMSVDGMRYWSCDALTCNCPAVHLEADEDGVLIRRVGCVINRAENDDLPPEQLSFEEVGR